MIQPKVIGTTIVVGVQFINNTEMNKWATENMGEYSWHVVGNDTLDVEVSAKKLFDVKYYDSEDGIVHKEVIFAMDEAECEKLLLENKKPSHRGGEIVFFGASEASIIGLQSL